MSDASTGMAMPAPLTARAASRSQRLRWVAWAAAGTFAGVLLLEAAVRLALGNAFLSPPVFQSVAGTLGYGLVPSVSAPVRQFGRVVAVSTDPAGHRLTPGAPAAAPVKLHLVGDSQVFGWGLSDEETFGARLQQQLGSGVEVVNHGVPGYGPDEYLAVLKTIPSTEPVVVVHTEENDGADAYALAAKNGVACSLIASFERESPLRCALMRSRLVQSVFVGLNRLHHRYHMTPPGFSDHSRVAGRVLHARIAERFSEHIAQRQGRILFTVVPWKGRYLSHWRALYAPAPMAGVRDMATPFPDSLETAQRFAAQPNAEALYLEGDTHLSPAGAQLLATFVAGAAKPLIGVAQPLEQR